MATKQKPKMSDQVAVKHHAMDQITSHLRDNPTITPGVLHTIAGLSMIPGVGGLLGLLGGAGEGATAAGEATGAAEEGAAAGEGTAARTGLKRLVPKTAKGKAALAGAGGLGALAYSKSKSQPPVNPAQPATGTSTTAPGSGLSGAGLMPLFMQSLMEPYLNSIMQQIHQTSQGYGNYMQGMISGKGPSGVALNPAIAQALQAMVPGQQATMNLMGQSGAGSVVAGGALDQLNAEIQKNIQTQQAAQGAYEKNLLLNSYNQIPGTGVTPLTNPLGAATGLTNPATNPLAKQIATGGGSIGG